MAGVELPLRRGLAAAIGHGRAYRSSAAGEVRRGVGTAAGGRARAAVGRMEPATTPGVETTVRRGDTQATGAGEAFRSTGAGEATRDVGSAVDGRLRGDEPQLLDRPGGAGGHARRKRGEAVGGRDGR